MTPAAQSFRRTFPILLIEDDPATIEVIKRAAKSGFPEAEFTIVTSFEEALTYLQTLQGKGPSLILLDVRLPRKHTGLDFLHLLKEHAIARLLPALILSQVDDQTHIRQAYQWGAASYIVKPFSLAEWKHFAATLRSFWFETATLPQTYFSAPPDR